MKANPQTKLINYRTYNLDRSKVIPIDRRSIFGNPFKIGEYYTRETCIKEYKIHFHKKLNNPWFREQLLKLKGETLGCWCRPDEGFKCRLLCHGQIIIAYLEGCKPEDVE